MQTLKSITQKISLDNLPQAKISTSQLYPALYKTIEDKYAKSFEKYSPRLEKFADGMRSKITNFKFSDLETNKIAKNLYFGTVSYGKNHVYVLFYDNGKIQDVLGSILHSNGGTDNTKHYIVSSDIYDSLYKSSNEYNKNTILRLLYSSYAQYLKNMYNEEYLDFEHSCTDKNKDGRASFAKDYIFKYDLCDVNDHVNTSSEKVLNIIDEQIKNITKPNRGL